MVKPYEKCDLNFRTPQFYPATFRVVQIIACKGKVIGVKYLYETQIPSLNPTLYGEQVEIPDGILKDPKVRTQIEKGEEEIRRHWLDKASTAVRSELQTQVTLKEGPNTWTVKAKPAECWLEWGEGKVFWEVLDLPVPEWAAGLRSLWDSSWK